MKRGFILVVLFVFVLSSLLFVSSALALNACCEQDKEGNWCQYTDENNCDENYLSTYTSCEQTSFCQVGCCYSSDEGSCFKNTPRATCEAEEDFSWSDSSDCAIDQCNKGCCVIADQAFFVTEVKCKSVGSAYEEASVSFDASIETESDCLSSVENLDYGCCVDGASATFQTREECDAGSTSVGVNFTVEGFHEDMLCSNDLLSTECAKQQYTACYQGKVYWYDSCGNRENIYSSDDRESYNNGYVLGIEDSCTASSSYDTNCGNCDYSLGMTCGADEENIMDAGDYTCIDLNCEETFQNEASPLSGSERKNGESWCVYDAAHGAGLDTVGSRHYRHLCINGEEVTEACTDYREEVCVGGVLGEDVLSNVEALHLGQGDYVEAACRENRADSCSSCNDETLGLTERYSCCAEEDTKDCYWLPTGANPEAGAEQVDGRCIPQVPEGLKFWSDSGSGDDASSSTVCSVASAGCTVTYRIGGVQKILSGGDDPDKWTVISESPDGCLDRDWLVDQNTYCRSLGDCGAYYNFVGEAGYDGFSSTMFDEEFFNEAKDIEALNEDDLGDWDSLKNVDEEDESHNFFSFDSPYFYENPAFAIATVSALVGGVSGVADCAGVVAAAGKEKEGDRETDLGFACGSNTDCSSNEECIFNVCKCKSGFVATADNICVAGGENKDSSMLAPEVPQFTGEKLVEQGKSAAQNKILSSILDSGGCFAKSALPIPEALSGIEKTSLTKFANWVTLIAAAYLIVDYAADNETTVTYSANCNMWQPPSGGDNCELCNDENMPCSEYRCHSLGASCTLINQGSANESCISQYANDVNSPLIEPLSGLEDGEYSLREVSEEGNKGYEISEKIPAFTPITLGISTDEPAQCKYSPEIGIEFESMNSFFGSEIYVYNHTLTFSLGDEITQEEVVALTEGIYTVYVRCADANGNANERDYFIRFGVDTTPDLTPPEVLYSSIQNGAYMQYGAEETAFSLYTNEPAQCKWNSNDTDYSLMMQSMDCADSGYAQSSEYYGSYACSTTLLGVAAEEINSFYFKCQDRSGNTNEDSFRFSTKQTESPLVISSLAPSETVYDLHLLLEAETEAGAENGKAICAYSSENVGYYSMAGFLTTNSTAHSQDLYLGEGEYTYYIVCQDIAGNQAGNSTSFAVEVDTDAPQLESLYVDTIYSVLTLLFDEASACEYAADDFVYGEGSLMTGINSTATHEANLEAYQYYVRCRDLYNNEGNYYIDLSTLV